MGKFLGLRGKKLVAMVTTLSSLSFLLFGYDNGVMSGIITSQQFFDVVGELSANTQGTVTSIFEVGAAVGSIATMFIGDKLGRRWMSAIGAIVLAIGAVLQAASYGVPQLIVGRIVTGLGMGVLTATAPIYSAECSPATDRGLNIAITLTSLIIGINIAYWVDYGFAYINSDISWRIPLALQIIFCIAIVVLVPILPESPRWLYLRGREDEGRETLAALRGVPNDDPTLELEISDIRAAIAVEEGANASWTSLVKDDGVKSHKRFALVMLAQGMQQLSGTDILTYYSTVIYEDSVGLSRNMSLLMGGFLQVWFLVASLLTWWTIDRAGRRKLFMLAFIGMFVCFMVLFGMLELPTSNKAAGIVAIVCIFMFQAFFTWGDMSTNWVYPSEVLTLSTRTKGAALSTALNWLVCFMVVQVTPPGIASIGPYFYLLFAMFNLVMAGLTYFFFIETASVSLEAIDSLFTDDNYQGWFHAVKMSKQLHKDARKYGNVSTVGSMGKSAGEIEHKEKIVA